MKDGSRLGSQFDSVQQNFRLGRPRPNRSGPVGAALNKDMARLDLGQEKRGCRLGTNERLSGGDRVPLPTELEFKHCPIPVEKRGL
jgi:hypothetical protein